MEKRDASRRITLNSVQDEVREKLILQPISYNSSVIYYEIYSDEALSVLVLFLLHFGL